MTRFILLLSGLVLLIGTSPALAEKRGVQIDGKAPADYIAEQAGKSWAVVIGINEYKNDIPKLRYAVADAQAVGRELEARGFSVTHLLDREATRDRILEVLGDDLPTQMKPDDRLLIFYAGHGETKTIVGGQTMGYLLPVEAQREKLHKTAISMGEIKQLAGLLPAKHVLFVVDVCYGGIAGQQTRSLPAQTEAYLKQITQEKGRQLITAGGPGQQVVEGPQWGHSVFTYYLLEGLIKGLADLNHDGVIPTSELYAYLDGRVPAASENQQRPEKWDLAPEKGEFVFFASATGRPRPSDATPQISGASTEEMATMKQRLEEMERRLTEQSKSAAPSKPIEEVRARPYAEPVQASREKRTFLGMTLEQLPPGGKTFVKNGFFGSKTVTIEKGLLVSDVEANSRASSTGIRAGDVILEFNRNEVRSLQDFDRFLRQLPTSETVILLLQRESNTLFVSVEPRQ